MVLKRQSFDITPYSSTSPNGLHALEWWINIKKRAMRHKEIKNSSRVGAGPSLSNYQNEWAPLKQGVLKIPNCDGDNKWFRIACSTEKLVSSEKGVADADNGSWKALRLAAEQSLTLDYRNVTWSE